MKQNNFLIDIIHKSIYDKYFKDRGYKFEKSSYHLKKEHYQIGFYWDYSENLSIKGKEEYYGFEFGIYTEEFGRIGGNFKRKIITPELYQCFYTFPGHHNSTGINNSFILREENHKNNIEYLENELSKLHPFMHTMEDTNSVISYFLNLEYKSSFLDFILSLIIINTGDKKKGIELLVKSYPNIGSFWQKQFKKAAKKNIDKLDSFEEALIALSK